MVEQTSPHIHTVQRRPPSSILVHKPLHISTLACQPLSAAPSSETVRRNIRLPTHSMGSTMAAVPIPEETAKNQAPQSPPPRTRSRPRSCAPSPRPAATAMGKELYLQVDPSGNRRWIQRLVIGGRRCELGLGGFPSRLAEGGADPGLRQPQDRTCRRRSARREAAHPGSPHVRRGSRGRGGAEALRLAQSEARTGLAGEPRAVRVSPGSGSAPSLEVHERRRPRSPGPDLAREAGDRATGPPPHRRRDAVGRGHGSTEPTTRANRSPQTLGRQRRVVPTHACAASCAGRRGPVATIRASGATTSAKLAFEFPGADGGPGRGERYGLARWGRG